MKTETITTDDCDTISSAIKLAQYYVKEHEEDSDLTKIDAETVDQALKTLRKLRSIAENPQKFITQNQWQILWQANDLLHYFVEDRNSQTDKDIHGWAASILIDLKPQSELTKAQVYAALETYIKEITDNQEPLDLLAKLKPDQVNP